MKYYMLDDDHGIVATDDFMEWAKWFEKIDRRRVGRDEFGDVSVSTVFLGVDYGFGGGPPILFETMVFGGALDGEIERYSTWDEAVEGHKKMIERVKEGT
jgi:hypothetical protein